MSCTHSSARGSSVACSREHLMCWGLPGFGSCTKDMAPRFACMVAPSDGSSPSKKFRRCGTFRKEPRSVHVRAILKSNPTDQPDKKRLLHAYAVREAFFFRFRCQVTVWLPVASSAAERDTARIAVRTFSQTSPFSQAIRFTWARISGGHPSALCPNRVRSPANSAREASSKPGRSPAMADMNL